MTEQLNKSSKYVGLVQVFIKRQEETRREGVAL